MVSKGLRRKNMKRKGLRCKTLRRKTLRRKTLRRKNVGRKTLRRKNVKRKTMRRKNVKRKTMRGGGRGLLTRAKQCFGFGCESHKGESSFDIDGLKLTVTNYEPPKDPLQYYNEKPLSVNEKSKHYEKVDPLHWMQLLETNAILRLITIIEIIGKNNYDISLQDQTNIMISGIFKRVKNATEVCTGNVDLGLENKGYPILSLLAKKLLRYFNETNTKWGENLSIDEMLKVVYTIDGSIYREVGGKDKNLYMKMKSESEENDDELFYKGIAHLIAYLIYDYEKSNENSEVSRLIIEEDKFRSIPD